MKTLTISLDDALAAQLAQAAHARGQDPNSYAVAVLADALARDQGVETERHAAVRSEAQGILNGPFHDAATSFERVHRKHNISDLSRLSADELAGEAERILAEMEPATRARMEREGLL